ncbi:hypothetical protein JOD69_003299 [Methylocaldum sp. RMAD-M]|jgi:hypothetical protein|nr:hypothetical protein [Methylocaldum sp. RMAD-M]
MECDQKISKLMRNCYAALRAAIPIAAAVPTTAQAGAQRLCRGFVTMMFAEF